MIKSFLNWFPKTGRVLDIGAGTGHIAEAVRDSGYDVIACDLVDLQFVGLPLVVADCTRLPFSDGTFDSTLLITVLHHMPAHLHALALQEGIRVLREGGRLIVMEDTFRGNIERLATYATDSIMNFEFVNHPHSNRSSEEWRNLISKAGANLLHSSEYIAWYGPFRFRHAIFVIEKAISLS